MALEKAVPDPMAFNPFRFTLRNWRQWRVYLPAVLLAYLVTLAFGTLLAPVKKSLETVVFDQYQRWLPRPYNFDQPVRIVDIDDEFDPPDRALAVVPPDVR